MKSLRGMPASRTAMTMISFSSWRTSATCVRRLRISESNIRGESLSSMNSSASFLRDFKVFGSRAPCFSIPVRLRVAWPGSRSARRPPADPAPYRRLPPRCRRRPRLPPRPRTSPLPRGQLHLGRVLRLRDHVRRVGIDEADNDIDQARLAGLHRLIGLQKEIMGGRIECERAAHGLETFLDAARDADLALARESSTVPISRMYIRTGSVVRPSSASSAASAAAASSIASCRRARKARWRATTRYPVPFRTPGFPCH